MGDIEKNKKFAEMKFVTVNDKLIKLIASIDNKWYSMSYTDCIWV